MKLKRKPKRPIKPAFPLGAGYRYSLSLRELVKAIDAEADELRRQLPNLQQQSVFLVDGVRNDDWIDSVTGLVARVRLSITGAVTEAKSASKRTAAEVSNFNRKQFQRVMRSVFGVDVITTDRGVQTALNAFATENASLITDIADKAASDIERIVVRGFTAGLRHEALSKDIQKVIKSSKKRADLIARDQVAKLNGSLTRLRQQDVGVEEYIWRTARDERVRSSHNANRDKKFKWAKAPAGTGHPGHDINCRCYAEPVLDGLL